MPLNRPPQRSAQKGVALAITLIMLVIMTLGGIAMIRSMESTTIVAGNLTFRQSATYSGDLGIAAAQTWLSNANVATLTCGSSGGIANCPPGYKSNGGTATDSPSAGQSWDNFWASSLASNAVTIAEDATGNTVSYFIHRLCEGTGALTAAGSNCVETPSVTSSGGFAKRAGAARFQSPSQVYYRITVRVAGKKNTVSYVQAIVAQ